MIDKLEATQLIVTSPEESASDNIQIQVNESPSENLIKTLSSIWEKYIDTSSYRDTYPNILHAHKRIENLLNKHEKNPQTPFQLLHELDNNILDIARADDPSLLGSFWYSRHEMTEELEKARAIFFDSTKKLEDLKKEIEQTQAATNPKIDNNEQTDASEQSTFSSDEKDRLIEELRAQLEAKDKELEETKNNLNETTMYLQELKGNKENNVSQINESFSGIAGNVSFWKAKLHNTNIPLKTPSSDKRTLKNILGESDEANKRLDLIDELLAVAPYSSAKDINLIQDIILNLILNKYSNSIRKTIVSVFASNKINPKGQISENIMAIIEKFSSCKEQPKAGVFNLLETQTLYNLYISPCFLLPDTKAEEKFKELLDKFNINNKHI